MVNGVERALFLLCGAEMKTIVIRKCPEVVVRLWYLEIVSDISFTRVSSYMAIL